MGRVPHDHRMLLLVGQNQLRETGDVVVAEHGSPRRQQVRIEEVHVKAITARRRGVDIGAALVGSDALAAGIKTYHGTAIIEGAATPVLQEPKKIMHPSVGPEVLIRAVTSGMRE